jgi:GT2 family glycosyltransferase
MRPRTSVVVLSWNGLPYLDSCMAALTAQSRPAAEILLVDNASTDGSFELVAARYPDVRITRNASNIGVAAGWNVGVEHARGDFVAFLNQDVEIESDWLARIEDAFVQRPQAGIIGSKLLFPDKRTIQHAGGFINYPRCVAFHYGYHEVDNGQYDELRCVDFVTGAAFAIKRKVLQSLDGFDEWFSPAYYEDADMCLRARHYGVEVIYAPAARAVHHESTSLGKGSHDVYYFAHKNRLRFARKHLSARQLLEDFLPAEVAVAGSPLGLVEAQALAEVHTEASALFLGEYGQTRGSVGTDAELIWQVAEELASRATETRSRVAQVGEDIAQVVARDAVFILVDGNQWGANEVFGGRRHIPFLERDGQYWGRPADDRTAIQELERLRGDGAAYIVFVWPTFWWLDFYTGFQNYLAAGYARILENERLIIFDLKQRG